MILTLKRNGIKPFICFTLCLYIQATYMWDVFVLVTCLQKLSNNIRFSTNTVCGMKYSGARNS
jgi:hypothetical protein